MYYLGIYSEHCMIFHKFFLTPTIWLFIVGIVSGYDPRGHQRVEDKLLINQPVFLPTQQNYTVSVGYLAVLSCAVENLGTKTVVWRKLPDDSPLTVGKMTFISDSRIQLHHVVYKKKWDLHIRDTKISDSGTYECQISTRERNRQLFYLNVVEEQEPSPTTHSGITITGNFHVEIGDTLKMTCNATELESPLEDIAWFKDGDALEGNPRIRIYKSLSLKEKTITSNLYIERVNMLDSGYYLCRTTSELTTHEHVQILNTTGNKDKRGTLISTEYRQDNNKDSKNIANSIHADVALFVAFFFEFLIHMFS